MQLYQDTVTDSNGNSVAGAVVTVSTYPDGLPAVIYAVQGGSAVDSVTTDRNGRFGFYAANGHYTITVAGAGITPISFPDVVLFDPAVLNPSTVDYGIAVGMAADQTAKLNAAIADTAARGATLKLMGRIRVDGQILLPSGASIVAHDASAIIDCTNSAITTSVLTATGTLGNPILVTAALARFAQAIQAPGHGLAVGDWFRIISTVDCQSAAAGDDRLGDRANVVYLTETHQVAAVPDANTIQIVGGLRFSYPSGSAVKKITPVTGIKLSGFKIEHASKVSSPILLTLCRSAVVEGVEVMRAGGEIAMRGCFGASKIVRCHAWGDLATASVASVALIKILDGSVGVNVIDCDVANGGQLVDVTYTPSLTNTLAAPTLDTTIKGGTCRNAYASAIVDHPACDGTTVQDVTMYDVRGAVFIRSRNGKVRNIRAWGGVFGDSGSIGVWAGENGYWAGLVVEDCEMHGFENGYYVGGSAATLGRSDVLFANNKSYHCTIGERWYSNASGQSDCGIRSQGSQHLFPITAGIKVESLYFNGIQFKDFVVRGPVTGSAVELAGSVPDAVIDGTVIDLGSTKPALYVSGGAPTNLAARIHRRGACGLNVGLTRAMVRPAARTLFTDATEAVLTGTTAQTTLKASVGVVPAGALDATASIKCTVYGKRVGSAGTLTVFLRPPEANVFTSVTFPIGAAGDFTAEFELYGTGAAAQVANSRGIINGGAAIVNAGINNASFDYSGGMSTIPLRVALSNAADTVKIETVVTEASWA